MFIIKALRACVKACARFILKLGVRIALLVAVLIAAANAWVYVSTQADIEGPAFSLSQERIEALDNHHAQCIVVLGAAVNPDQSLSPVLQSRVDAAVELYKKGVAPLIIMSGDGRERNYHEPMAMARYAQAQGVPSSALVLDPGGYHTFDTMWRLKRINHMQSCIVVTQGFHIHRAVFDARGLGIDAHGVISDSGVYDEQPFYELREVFARVQDVWRVITNASPDNPSAAFEPFV